MEEKNNDVGPEEETNSLDTTAKVEEGDSKDADSCSENQQVPSQKQEEEVIKKKYGSLLPKKHPLISKDNERAFFDSADWALGKVGAQKSKGPLEALRPKLQPTPHQHTRSRSAYAHDTPADGGEDGFNFDDLNPGENQDSAVDSSIESHMENQNLQN